MARIRTVSDAKQPDQQRSDGGCDTMNETARDSMKSIAFTIWILAVSLLFAATDTLPDPPALKPTAVAACSIQTPPDGPVAFPARACEFFTLPNLQAEILLPASRVERDLTWDSAVLIRRAADSSPPASRA